MQRKFLWGLGAILGLFASVAFGADPAAAAIVGLCVGNIEVKDLEALQETLKKGLKEVREQTGEKLETALQEVKTIGTLVGDTNKELTKLGEKSAEVQQRLLEVEQKLAHRGNAPDPREVKSLGAMVSDSDEFKAALALGSRAREIDAVQVGSFHKTAIINATGQNQPLVPSDRLGGIVTPAERLLTIRSLIPVGTTDSNLIEYAKENVFTNNAGPQYSSPAKENVAKNESAITFTLATAAVVTLAHWIPASRQVLADAGMLRGYIDGRLTYGMKLEEEDEILNGDGTGGKLDGLINQATAYTGATTGDQALDTLLRAFLQVTTGSEFVADGAVLNHADWTGILLLKDTTGRYLFGDPGAQQAPRVWGRPVVPTNSMTAGSFLVGAFTLAAQLWDREQATIRVAEQHSDFFVKNMVAILAEERLALTVFRPTALVKGTL